MHMKHLLVQPEVQLSKDIRQLGGWLYLKGLISDHQSVFFFFHFFFLFFSLKNTVFQFV